MWVGDAEQRSGGRYHTYKAATRAVFRWLACVQPPAPQCVSELLTAAKKVVARSLPPPAHVIADLNCSIRLRQQVNQWYSAASLEPDKDRSHAYFLAALVEVRRMLLTIPSKDLTERLTKLTATDESPRKANIFSVLEEEQTQAAQSGSGTDSVEQQLGLMVGHAVQIGGLISKPQLNGRIGHVEQYLPDSDRYRVVVDGVAYALKTSALTRVEGTAEERSGQVTFDTLDNSPSFAAACLLLDLQDQIRMVEETWTAFRDGEISVRELLVASALTNASVRHMERISSQLEAEFPALSSLERIVTATHLSEAVSRTQELLQSDYATALDVVALVAFGDAEKCTGTVLYHNDTASGIPPVPATHALRLKLEGGSQGEATRALAAKMITHRSGTSTSNAEAILEDVCQASMSNVMRLDASGQLNSPNDMLAGHSGLLHTSERMRISMRRQLRHPRLLVDTESYGPEWNEQKSPASSTVGLIDFLVRTLYMFCYHYGHDDFNKLLNDISAPTLMPLFTLLHKSLKAQHFSLAALFMIHANLMAVLRVQGDHKCTRVAILTKATLGR